jgi:hypothetical protein
MNKKRTGWYPGHIKPAREGIYERERNSIIIFSYWDGSVWCVGARSIHHANVFKYYKANYQNTPWRGLCKSPE